MLNRHHDPQLIRNALFARCKLYWGAGLISKLVVFIVGILVVVAPIDAKVFAVIGIVLAVVSEFLMWQSDRWKGAASGLHRKLDYENSFGWHLSESELLDYLARFPGNTDELVGKPTGSYFASNESQGPKRAVENLRESTWWSMHLAESMYWRSVAVILAIVIGCILLLNASVSNFSEPPTTSSVSTTITHKTIETKQGVSAQTVKIVTSTILFIFSYGLLKFATGYYSFSSKSRQVKEGAELLIKSGNIDIIPAIKLWQDYHLAREAAPIIPTWIWRQREKRLNKLWEFYVKRQGQV